jgi:predicted nucleic acid-binding protein
VKHPHPSVSTIQDVVHHPGFRRSGSSRHPNTLSALAQFVNISDVPFSIPLFHLQGNLVFDADTAVLMKEHGLKTTYTRDTAFNCFRFLDVVDPIQDIRRTTRPR